MADEALRFDLFPDSRDAACYSPMVRGSGARSFWLSTPEAISHWLISNRGGTLLTRRAAKFEPARRLGIVVGRLCACFDGGAAPALLTGVLGGGGRAAIRRFAGAGLAACIGDKRPCGAFIPAELGAARLRQV